MSKSILSQKKEIKSDWDDKEGDSKNVLSRWKVISIKKKKKIKKKRANQENIIF